MNWFDTAGLTSLAKTALKGAQKTIDKALDIEVESGEEQDDESPTASAEQSCPGNANSPQKDNADFFSSWGLTVSAESAKDDLMKEQTVVTQSPSKSNSQSVWGSFAGSFFEQSKNPNESTIVKPPKAKSMNVISDAKYDSQDDLFSKSQLVMSDGDEFKSLKKEDVALIEERRGSSRSNILSLVSSLHSSDSVEVLSQSLKTTPDSETSAQSMSQSSSIGQKHNSESVEILPDSLLSPSSIECLGFDSISSDKNSSSSSDLTPDMSDKKSTPLGERTEKVDTADSVSLVADDDEDTMSYNSVSECTAPTVLDTDEKPMSPFSKALRTETRKELIQLEHAMLPKMQISENSSNDGSWSDRTLNADNDSINLDIVEEQKKDGEQEDILIEKLSDSSSFYNVNVTSSMLQSTSSAFVNIEKQQCNTTSSSESSQKEGSVKERTSPISSDSKSDLVKIGSDRTSGHTSGDELETTTSSDIEIIPSPNGDNGHSFCRSSPAKYAFKQGKFDDTTSPNIVDVVLGKSLATKIRGHNRELSEASVQSDDSQSSENDRLMRRLSEMTEILEARENRLMEVSRSNAELAESNADLKSQVDSLLAKPKIGDGQESGDINTITEDYTQRMSALEKKFQQAIREKDQLRKQLDSLKSETSSRKLSSELDNSLKEKDDVIAQLQEEGEKLARQQLQHSNIIKKLRTKEKDNEQVIKSLRDKIAEQTAELDRLKRSMAAKEELEVNQIEAVYRLTTTNKKLDTELAETKSELDDTTQRLESTRASLEAARRELSELQRSSAELQRRRELHARLDHERETAERERERAAGELRQLRADVINEEKKWRTREEALRRELCEARELCAALEAGTSGVGTSGAGEACTSEGAGVLAQLAALQAAALDRERAHRAATAVIANQRDEVERALAKAVERERVSREESLMQTERLVVCEGLLQGATEQCQQLQQTVDHLQLMLNERTRELESLRSESETRISELQERVSETEQRLAESESALDTEKKRNTILQEQLSVRGDLSPVQSLASDTMSASLWHPEEMPNVGVSAGPCSAEVEALSAVLSRQEGELRAALQQRTRLQNERDALRDHAAQLQASLDDYQSVQEQYDALLQMYGEKEEQLAELRLDLYDVTQLYKAQLDELVALKQRQQR